MEKTIKEIKENAKTLENAILKLISDFEKKLILKLKFVLL